MPSFFRFLFPAFLLLLCAVASPSRAEDAAAISEHVKQLGSRNFKERETATQALETIGYPALDALRAAAKGHDLDFTQRVTRLISIIENSLDSLLADYGRYGLPMPPRDAKLVRYVLEGDMDPPTYFLAFLLEPATEVKPALLLVGTEKVRLNSPTFPCKVVEAKPEVAKGLEDRPWWGYSAFEMNASLAIALQCKARGWDALAKQMWTWGIKHRRKASEEDTFLPPANLSNRAAVAYLAWAYSGNELVSSDIDRTKTAKRMKSLLAAEPLLNTKSNQAILKSLEAALVPSKAKAGTIERMIDDLMNMCLDSDLVWQPFYDNLDPRYARLAQMGFAAVPSLIEHLDDDRLTRSLLSRGDRRQILQVKHLVSDILLDLMGERIGPRREGRVVTKLDAKAWWAKNRKAGEELYLLSHVLPSGEMKYPNYLMLEIVTNKYPQQLEKLYKTILDERPEMYSWTVAEVIGKSSLPAEKKRALWLYAARHKNLGHRHSGLEQLQKVDPQQFLEILLATLESLPKTPTWPGCPEAGYANLVTLTDSPRAWDLLEKVAKRSDVVLRNRFLDQMKYGDARKQQRLKFLAAFLDDAEAPKVKAGDQDSRISLPFTLEVRNLAAMQIALILKMLNDPDRKWTPQQWAELRKKAKEAIKP